MDGQTNIQTDWDVGILENRQRDFLFPSTVKKTVQKKCFVDVVL